MSDEDKIKETFNTVLVATAQLARNLHASASPNVYPPALGESRVAFDKSLKSFHTALDVAEISLIQARDTLQRDLNKLQQSKQPLKTENCSAQSQPFTIDIE
ncbi:uncharacterized protein V1513DRAFT_439403 [Lipomyces chichibuensis]|uniref:uncharacterized protein n=1 Tax=Lipomyces chichibuensis TaxID=1546026 RepID=UPI0033436DE0